MLKSPEAGAEPKDELHPFIFFRKEKKKEADVEEHETPHCLLTHFDGKEVVQVWSNATTISARLVEGENGFVTGVFDDGATYETNIPNRRLVDGEISKQPVKLPKSKAKGKTKAKGKAKAKKKASKKTIQDDDETIEEEAEEEEAEVDDETEPVAKKLATKKPSKIKKKRMREKQGKHWKRRKLRTLSRWNQLAKSQPQKNKKWRLVHQQL